MAMRRVGFEYAGAAVLVVLSYTLTLVLKSRFGITDVGFFMLASFTAAALFRLGPALVAAAGSIMVSSYYFMPPYGSFEVAAASDLVRLLAILLIVIGVTFLKSKNQQLEQMLHFWSAASQWSNEGVGVCSVCQKISLGRDVWLSSKDFFARLHVDSRSQVCPSCSKWVV